MCNTLQLAAAAAAPALPVQWVDCARAASSASSSATCLPHALPPSIFVTVCSPFPLYFCNTLRSYCLPYSDVQPHPATCALDGKKSSFYRSAEGVDCVRITVVFGGKVFLHRIDAHWCVRARARFPHRKCVTICGEICDDLRQVLVFQVKGSWGVEDGSWSVTCDV